MLATAIQQRSITTANGGGVLGGSGVSGGGVLNNNNNCFYAATAPLIPTANLPHNTNTTAVGVTTSSVPPTAISPTFIEHKYSANTFKEKFFVNLRQQNPNNKLKPLKTNSINQMSDKNAKNLNEKTCSSIKNSDGSNETISLHNQDVVTTNEKIAISCGNNNNINSDDNSVENVVGGGVNNINNNGTDLCSTIQQQLSENVKNNLYKKSIN